jgi:hypothetical protein
LRLAAVVGAGLALRLAVAFGPLRHLPLVSDAADYAGQAAQMARGDPVPAYYWPPGTSYVIAAFYDVLGVHPWVAKLSAILVDAANVALVAMLAARLVTNRCVPIVAGGLYAAYPSAVLMAAQPFSLQRRTLSTDDEARNFAGGSPAVTPSSTSLSPAARPISVCEQEVGHVAVLVQDDFALRTLVVARREERTHRGLRAAAAPALPWPRQTRGDALRARMSLYGRH